MTTDPVKWVRIFSYEEAVHRVQLNSTVRATIYSQKICIAHTPKGWFAIEDQCPHLGESLSKGNLNFLNEITCPWHSYRYSLYTGRECEGRGRDALTYPMEMREDGLYIAIRNTGSPQQAE